MEKEPTRAASMVSLRRGLSQKRVTPRAGLIAWLDGRVGCEADLPRWVGGASGEGCFALGAATLLVGGVDGVGTGRKTVAGSRWLPIR